MRIVGHVTRTRLLHVSESITPDDKNWTWVLERLCTECGFDASSFDARNIGTALRDQAQRWVAVLGGSTVAQRTRPDMWSTLEYGCHVRDVFKKFNERLQLMVNDVDPAFENWDQDATAIAEQYHLQDPVVVASELRIAAEELADRFDQVRSDQWSRRGFRSDGSAFTIDSIARYLLHDPVHHLMDVGAEVPTY